MKYILISTLTSCILLFFAACGDNTENNTENKKDTVETQEQTTIENKTTVEEEIQTGITLDDLKKIKFAGIEPGWTLVFKDKHLNYTQGYSSEIIKMVYYGDHDGSNERIKVISKNEIQVKLIAETALDKGFIWVATIKKEECNDGMSDNKYPYSIKIKVEEGFKTACGMIMDSKTNVADDFSIFWKKIQKTIAGNDKNGLMAMCNESTKDFLTSE